MGETGRTAYKPEMTRNMVLLNLTGLGLFWGLSPALYRLLGEAHVPVSHIIVLTGAGVALGLALLQLVRRGQLLIDRRVLAYGLGCGLLLNIPFALSLWFARHLPVSTYAVVVSTAPLWTYAVALLSGREGPSPWRFGALGLGFLASLALIVTRETDPARSVTAGLVAASFAVPMLYAAYNSFCSMAWPRGMDSLAAGIAESAASALIVLPLMVWFDPPSGVTTTAFGYWLILAATLMWVVERIVYFGLIRHAGPVSTVQAVYISTPGGVLFGVVLFKDHADLWLVVSLALVMAALVCNNRATRALRRA